MIPILTLLTTSNRTLLQRSSNKVYPNFYLGPWECDILEITKSGYTYEYEVKISPEEIDEVNKKIYFRYHKLRLKEYGQKLVTPFGIS